MRTNFKTRHIFSCGVLAVLLAVCAVPASAAPIELTAGNGTYRVIYDDALQSPYFDPAYAGFATIRFPVNTTFVGDPATDGCCVATVFTLELHNLRFIPNPGFAFSSLNIWDSDPVGYHHGYYGGEEWNQSTTITALDNSSSQVLNGPYSPNFPPWGQGGGGAFNFGINIWTVAPPSAGFNVSVDQWVRLWDTSSWRFSSVDFELQTVGVTASIPEPETYAMLLAGLGLLGFAARRRKRDSIRD